MKRIRLLTLTSLHYLIVYTFLSAITFILFFIFLKSVNRGSMNEALSNRKDRILTAIRKNGNRIPSQNFDLNDFRIIPAPSAFSKKEFYSDTSIAETGDEEEFIQFRKLKSYEKVGNENYQFEIVVPVVEKEALVNTILKTSVFVFVLMLIIFLLTTRFFSKKLWGSFYKTLGELNNYEIDRNESLVLNQSRIAEFAALNQAITDLTTRAASTFNNQKQFIENASHELQTPLAINQNKLEELTDDPDLTASQSEIVHTLINSNQRMIRLNKTLLLLSKIDNGQFPGTETVYPAALIRESLTLFEDQQSKLDLTLIAQLDQNTILQTNRTLADLIISNLVKNSLVHNRHQREVVIQLTATQLKITNTSNGLGIPPDKAFQRFYKNTSRQESWGLGLAMVKKICILNNWQIDYNYHDERHIFILSFA